ncbi:glutamine-hydrolyzing GMP synthase [Engelhardtia mirabilis]|uniref:GMP synthase [glutamine-hydrolyzing] n=1 Tax=Engelhardtia mirabilis TaxID=2528011 RepID=A0A518BJ97_9BACT|nr:GMP synthase [glutamine-hydrolyzing] [Planctomycetes bacterium Pla133]QDV01365.1 GMP synthase [glutamine-hydrolyzing] [Planctomycetes bacterium Pla86]
MPETKSIETASAVPATAPDGILVVDLGAQYAQLIARRVREANVWSEIAPPSLALETAARMNLKGIVLSGGPASVYASDAPQIPTELLELGVPVLGICYGMQWMTQTLGGEVLPANAREFGRTSIAVAEPEALFRGLDGHTVVWMSHGDQVAELPEGFRTYATSENCPFAAVGDPERGFFGIQFHPEVTHTVRGREVIDNFIHAVCGAKDDWSPDSIVDAQVARVREQVGEHGEVVLGLSGGVDSSVAAVILHKAIGDRLHCIFVDNGLLRKGERQVVETLFGEHFQMDLTVVDAGAKFLAELAGVTDPERKRKIIGHEFVEVFREEAKRFKQANFLGQGTLYPDVIESIAAHGGSTDVIKSHHNVGGLPDDLEMELIEPLRELFKDEVRAIGRQLGLASVVVDRQPFPGPGLAVRIVGEITPENVRLLQEADAIVTSEIEAVGADEGLWQYFAVLLPVKSVGVMGDARTYESCCALRVVQSEDAMTADWAYLPQELLQRISNRIINEVRGINRVVLDISSKPPATIEWE